MGLFVSKRNTTEPTVRDLQQQLGQCQEKSNFFLLSILSLLYFIRDFSLDIKEIHSDKFKEEIDKLSGIFQSDEDIKKPKKIFEKKKTIIVDYIKSEKEFLREKDKELKDIIELLTESFKEIGSENQSFNAQIYAHSAKLEKITQLDDIRKIKEALKQGLQQLKQAVRDKQERDARRLTCLASKVASLQEDVEQAKSAALTDGLTGVCNRAALDQYLAKLIGRNAVSPISFSLLLFDIDNFKQINDTYGHPVGDRAIIALAQRCRDMIRKDDFLARYGGEEFALILTDTSLRHAVKKARLICQAIAAMHYIIDARQAHQKLRFTISIGVSVVRPGDTVTALVERADKALYIAKHQGKNCVVTEKEVA